MNTPFFYLLFFYFYIFTLYTPIYLGVNSCFLLFFSFTPLVMLFLFLHLATDNGKTIKTKNLNYENY